MDLRALTPLLTEPGPFVTLYLPTHRDVEQAAAAFDVLWKDVRRDLADRGVDGATLAALDAARGSHADGGTLVLVAAGGRVVLRRALPEATDTTVVRVGPLPHLLPLLDWASTRVPHVVALVDHAGADVLAYGDGDAPVDAAAVPGAEGPVHKTGKGGYAEQRYQRNVENSWDETAHRAASAIAGAVAEVSARVVLLGGDAREAGLVRAALPADVQPLVVDLRGGRAADGGSAHLADEVLQALAERLAAETAEALERFATYRGRATKDRARTIAVRDDEPAGTTPPALQAADGVDDVVAALRMGAVDTLLLALSASVRQQVGLEERTALVGPDPLQLGLTAADLAAIGVAEPVEVPLLDALTRAALAQDAVVRLVPADVPDAPADGAGGLLRYSLPAS